MVETIEQIIPDNTGSEYCRAGLSVIFKSYESYLDSLFSEVYKANAEYQYKMMHESN